MLFHVEGEGEAPKLRWLIPQAETARFEGKLSTSSYDSSAGDVFIMYMSFGCNGVTRLKP